MRKAIGIGVMAALVAGLGLSSIPATVYAEDSTGQADETAARKNDGIYEQEGLRCLRYGWTLRTRQEIR